MEDDGLALAPNTTPTGGTSYVIPVGTFLLGLGGRAALQTALLTGGVLVVGHLVNRHVPQRGYSTDEASAYARTMGIGMAAWAFGTVLRGLLNGPGRGAARPNAGHPTEPWY